MKHSYIWKRHTMLLRLHLSIPQCWLHLWNALNRKRCIHLLFPLICLLYMSKTVPLKTTESEEQEPVLPSTINMPSTSRNTDGLEINDEFCSFDIIMPQQAVALKIGEQEESVRSVFPLFLSHFHLSVCALQITVNWPVFLHSLISFAEEARCINTAKKTDGAMTASQNC